MANVIPFRGVLYDPSSVPDLSQVVAPPYDVIDAQTQRALHDRHPYNVIRLELGLPQPDDDGSRNQYTRAAALLQSWLRSDVLRRDPAAAVYLCTVEYQTNIGGLREQHTLRGFLATIELEEFGTGRILPHEDTRSAAKMDRFRLLEHCRANFSPIFALFSDPGSSIMPLLEKAVDEGRPRVEFLDEAGFRQRLWSVTDRAVLHDLTTAMQSKPLFIADGHHRYETALAYRRMCRERAGKPSGQPSAGGPSDRQPYDGVLMLISSLEDPGLTVLPTHRVLRIALPPFDEIKRRLHESFLVEDIPFQGQSEATARTRLLRSLRERGSQQLFGLARSGGPGYLLVTAKPEYRERPGTSARDRLDVSVLHERVLRVLSPELDEHGILYTKDEHEALNLVQSGQAQGAFILNPTKVTEVQAVAAAGHRMPHKSTYFFPKPLTGLVMNVFDEDRETRGT